MPTGRSGQGFLGVAARCQTELGAEAFHVEYGADLANLLRGRQGPERHRGDAQHLVAGWIAERGCFDGADQGAPGHHLVAFGDALFDDHFEIGHGAPNLGDHRGKRGAGHRVAGEGTLVEKILAVQLLGQRHVAAVPGQFDVLTDQAFVVVP